MANIAWQNSVNWYISQFPESQFLVAESNKHDYNKKTILGHTIAQKSNVLICGIMRNLGSVMPYTLARIEALGKLFKSHHIFMYENDSIDATRSKLIEWQNTNPDNISIKYEDVGPPPFHDPKGLPRRRWMARARNQYLEFARDFVSTHRIHYLIIVDTDLLGGWSYHGVLNSLGHKNWDVVGSNSLYYFEKDGKCIRLFYDAWAFRADGDPSEIEDVRANLFQFHRGESLIKVNSCFGGVAIYRPEILYDNLWYDETDCDHPTLHNVMCENGYAVFLNPSQITLYNKTQYIV